MKPSLPVRAAIAPLVAGLLSSAPLHAASFTELFTFQHFFNRDGAQPNSALTFDGAGDLYGTTSAGAGTLFRLDPATGAFHLLFSFRDDAVYGGYPAGGLALAPDNALYGVTTSGGSADAGTIFRYDLKTHALDTVYNLKGYPVVGLSTPMIPGRNHVLYAVSATGGSLSCDQQGAGGCGIIYAFDYVKKMVRTVHPFTGGTDGERPQGLILDTDGQYYGVAYGGGANGGGVIYKIDPATGAFAVVHDFATPDRGPAFPGGSLAIGRDGVLYGAVQNFKKDKNGFAQAALYSFDPANGAFKILYVMDGATEGAGPAAGLIRNSNGDLCGTTVAGGSHDDGTIFCFKPSTAALTIVQQLTPATGVSPNPLLAGAQTLMYGSTGREGPAKQSFVTLFVAKP